MDLSDTKYGLGGHLLLFLCRKQQQQIMFFNWSHCLCVLFVFGSCFIFYADLNVHSRFAFILREE